MYVDAVIDVSEFNSSVDFSVIKNAGIVGVFHRATIGSPELVEGHTQTYQTEDREYRGRELQAKKQGLLWGAYHYGLGGCGAEQARYFLQVLRAIDQKTDILMALDFEEPKGRGEPMELEDAKSFILEVYRQTGHYPLLYGGRVLREKIQAAVSSGTKADKDALAVLRYCKIWIPRYGEESTIILPPGWSAWTFWQYTDKGKFEGLKGFYDRNRFKGSRVALEKFWRLESIHINGDPSL
ncbi:MAG: glycoside hydrolase family 25 protein [Candidatus Aquirickettsiella sp.]